jgi:transcription antitermination protein NusB
MATIRKRTRAREIAIQALYQEDAHHRIGGPSEREEIDRFIDREASTPEVREFAHQLVTGTRESQEEIDALLASVVENWKVERIAAMDRAILRLATFELLARPDVPPKVSINEAIDLAKKYSTAQSGGFVNGILDRLLKMKEAGGTKGAGQ